MPGRERAIKSRYDIGIGRNRIQRNFDNVEANLMQN